MLREGGHRRVGLDTTGTFNSTKHTSYDIFVVLTEINLTITPSLRFYCGMKELTLLRYKEQCLHTESNPDTTRIPLPQPNHNGKQQQQQYVIYPLLIDPYGSSSSFRSSSPSDRAPTVIGPGISVTRTFKVGDQLMFR